jgi:quercetin dioxygenase-like cupin family protein
MMTNYFRSVNDAVGFAADAPTKADLFGGLQMFVGLNCFEPGQSQPIHTHGGADKFYLVLRGKASMVVGEETREVGEGTVVWAPADVPHGVARVMTRTVMLVAIAPPPRAVSRSRAP